MPKLHLPTSTLAYQDWLEQQQLILARRERLDHSRRKALRLSDWLEG